MKNPLFRSLGAAVASCLVSLSFLGSESSAQTVLADSMADWSATGTQGENSWFYGYYNLTSDGDATYDANTDFVVFANDGSGVVGQPPALNQWTGNQWDFGAGAPWTNLQQEAAHPNGTNSAPNEEHWVIRRWVADVDSDVRITFNLRAQNTNGTGTTAILFQNGVELERVTNSTGVDQSKTATASVFIGDSIDLALTPEGTDGNRTDGSDGSFFSMTVVENLDSDSDGLPDDYEQNIAGNLTDLDGSLSGPGPGAGTGDFDGDGLDDAGEFANGTNPLDPDTDDDGYTDKEELDNGSNPNDANSMPAALAQADSRGEWDVNGVQGTNGWNYGYRNYTADGGGDDYDPVSDFIEFPNDLGPYSATNFWDGGKWDWFMGNAPWTEIGQEGTHPNSGGGEHWTIRRWTSDYDGSARIIWNTREVNNGGTGVGGAIHVNGIQVDAQATDTLAGFTRTYYVNVATGDVVDLVLTPVGPTGDRADGADGSANWMWIDDRFPAVPIQPNGKYFVPLGSDDTDTDGMADFWELIFAPDLDLLFSGNDNDGDALNDEDEQAAGTDPTLFDTDSDGLSDGEEVNTHGSNPCVSDTDGDGLTDFEEINGSPATDPTAADSDGDGFSDFEEINEGSDPNDVNETPATIALSDSRSGFSGVDGQDGWRHGYRNVSLDGGGIDYDAVSDFIPFPVDGTDTRSGTNFWNGADYDWFNDPINPAGNAHNPPWTQLAQEGTHPNGTNNAEEHWTVRRWTASGLGGETPVRIRWHVRGNGAGTGVTGAVHLNGVRVNAAALAGADNVGVFPTYYVHLNDGDIVDLILSPVGATGDPSDGSDSSFNWMRLDTAIPDVPIQPNGKYFIPNDAEDTDTDGLADFWEEVFFPGDLNQLTDGGNDWDGDGLDDVAEQAAGTDPAFADTDGDGLSDGDEATAGTDPCSSDSDGDGFTDGQEVCTGFDPLNGSDNALNSATIIADSDLDFPFGLEDPQGYFGWTYGYYNVTADGAPPANTNFIPFPTDGTSLRGIGNFWDGTTFDWVDGAGAATNPPWTFMAQVEAHPNGDNNGDVHWVVRRWEVDATGPLALTYSLSKSNVGGGNGTTALLIHNGQVIDSITVGGTDGAGLRSWSYVNAGIGDTVEVALSPKGTDGTDNDGADGSFFWLLVDETIPAGAKQPDGSPFVIGGDPSNLLDVHYEAAGDDLQVRWTNQPGKEYQLQYSATGDAPWTNYGPTLGAQVGGINFVQFNDIGLPGGTYIFRILELDP